MSEHTVAIVSFEGALKREVKRIRRQLALDETMSSFMIRIDASGRVDSGEVDISFGVGDSSYGATVNGDGLDTVVEELMRRRGWTARHAPKALFYEKIPSDDTEESSAPESEHD